MGLVQRAKAVPYTIGWGIEGGALYHRVVQRAKRIGPTR
jgi:hypothetical protein